MSLHSYPRDFTMFKINDKETITVNFNMSNFPLLNFMDTPMDTQWTPPKRWTARKLDIMDILDTPLGYME